MFNHQYGGTSILTFDAKATVVTENTAKLTQ